MTSLPPLFRDQRKIDAGHLQLLGILHCVLAGLSVVGLGFLFLHRAIMQTVLNHPEAWNTPKGGGPPPAEFFAIFQWVYLIMGGLIVVGGVLNAISGWCILKQRARMFSLIVAGVDCLMFPFGTVLGVFTFVVLLRDSVLEVYEADALSAPSGPPALPH